MDEISKIEEVDTLSNTFTIEEQVKNYTLLEKLNLIFDYVKKLQFEKGGTKIYSTTDEELVSTRFTGHNGINVDMDEEDASIFNIRLDEDIVKALEDMNVDIENLTEIVGELTPKVMRALLTPVTKPSTPQVVVIDETNAQTLIDLLSFLTTNTEQTIMANKILHYDATIRSNKGSLLKADDINAYIGNIHQHIRLNGNNTRPDYHDGTNTTDIALLSDVMTPSNQKITNIFESTAVGGYYYTAPSNGYFWIFCAVDSNAKCWIDNITKSIGSGVDTTWSGVSQSMNCFVPCAKGDRIYLDIQNKPLKGLYNAVFINSIGGVQ